MDMIVSVKLCIIIIIIIIAILIIIFIILITIISQLRIPYCQFKYPPNLHLP